MAEPIDISGYVQEYEEHGEILLRAKWAMDGAETLDEAAGMLRAFADELEALASAGFHLMQPIEDDHGFAHRGEPIDEEEVRPLPRRLVVRRQRLREDAGLTPERLGPCGRCRSEMSRAN